MYKSILARQKPHAWGQLDVGKWNNTASDNAAHAPNYSATFRDGLYKEGSAGKGRLRDAFRAPDLRLITSTRAWAVTVNEDLEPLSRRRAMEKGLDENLKQGRTVTLQNPLGGFLVKKLPHRREFPP